MPITAPPLINSSGIQRIILLLSPVFGLSVPVFGLVCVGSVGFVVEPVAGISTAAFL